MADKKELINILKEHLSLADIQDRGRCIVIYGDWGTGKTFFWNNQFKSNVISENGAKYNNFGYVSLFGHKSIETIKKESLESVYFSSKANPILKAAKKYVDKGAQIFKASEKAQLALLGVDALLSVIGSRDLGECIICFDDIERCHNDLNLDEFLGYVAQLVEDKKCKVVLLMNRKELFNKRKEENNNDKNTNDNQSNTENISVFEEIYQRYKEKVIDLEVEFTPTIKNNFDTALNIIGEESLQKHVVINLEQIITNLQENNIRVIYKSLETVKKFYEHIKDMKDIQPLISNILSTIFIFSLIHWRFGNVDDELKSGNFTSRDISNDEQRKYLLKSKYNDNKLGSYDNKGYIPSLFKYLESGIFELERIKFIIQNIINSFSYNHFNNQLDRITNSALYDLNYSIDNFVNDIIKLHNTIDNSIYDYYNFSIIYDAINYNLKGIDKGQEIASKIFQQLKPTEQQFYQFYEKAKKSPLSIENDYLETFLNVYPEFRDRIKNTFYKYNIEDLNKILEDYTNNKFDDDIVSYFNNMSETFLEEVIFEPTIFKSIHKIIKYNVGVEGTHYKTFLITCGKVFTKLKNTPEFKYKIDYILNHMSLQVEYIKKN